MLLGLHGAVTTPTRLDPDREMVERARAVVGRHIPLVVALDYHANIDVHLTELVDAVFGYHYSPHTAIEATGERAADCLLRTVRGSLRPVMAFAKPGVMVPSIFSTTGLSPLKEIVDASVAMAEREPGCLDVSVFTDFSYADVPNCASQCLPFAACRSAARKARFALRRASCAAGHPAVARSRLPALTVIGSPSQRFGGVRGRGEGGFATCADGEREALAGARRGDVP